MVVSFPNNFDNDTEERKFDDMLSVIKNYESMDIKDCMHASYVRSSLRKFVDKFETRTLM